MNPYLILGWIGSVGLASWLAFGFGQDDVKADNADKAALVAEVSAKAQEGAAAAIAALVPVNKTIVQKVQHEIQTNTVYAECRNTPVGLSGINAAITGRAIPASGSKLP